MRTGSCEKNLAKKKGKRRLSHSQISLSLSLSLRLSLYLGTVIISPFHLILFRDKSFIIEVRNRVILISTSLPSF